MTSPRNLAGWTERPPSPPLTSHAAFPTTHSNALSDGRPQDGSSIPISPSPILNPRGLPSPVESIPIPRSENKEEGSSTPRRGSVQIPLIPGPGVVSPPTPAPSPNPREKTWGRFAASQGVYGGETSPTRQSAGNDVAHMDEGADEWKGKDRAFGENTADHRDLIDQFEHLDKAGRFAFLQSLVESLALPEALVLSRNIEPRLRRDFLRELPIELALKILTFVDDAQSLTRASQVSRYWKELLSDENTWKEMCRKHNFPTRPINPPARYLPLRKMSTGAYPTRAANLFRPLNPRKPLSFGDPPAPWSPQGVPDSFASDSSYKQQYKKAYLTENNWLRGGHLIANHSSSQDTVVTALSFDENFIVIGMANSGIHVFETSTGSFRRSLRGHEAGVWALVLVSAGQAPQGQARSPSSTSADPFRDESTSCPFGMNNDARSEFHDPCGAATGWGNRRPLVISGGCDKIVKVWDALSGECLHSLEGHTSTVRCLKVIQGRPIACSGSRDSTLRLWDIQKGTLRHLLEGHEQSVRCIDAAGNKVVSGSYDFTCKVWNVDNGQCLHTLRGHYHQIYAVAFDGERIVTGSLDSTVRIWSATTGQCISMLQGHTSLVGQMQLVGDRLVTGGSDGRVIIFNLANDQCVHRLCAHDNSVTCLQFDDRYIVSGGNDGRVKLWDVRTGAFIRELTGPCDAVWRVAFKNDVCAILLQRKGKTILEVISFRPGQPSHRKLPKPIVPNDMGQRRGRNSR